MSKYAQSGGGGEKCEGSDGNSDNRSLCHVMYRKIVVDRTFFTAVVATSIDPQKSSKSEGACNDDGDDDGGNTD